MIEGPGSTSEKEKFFFFLLSPLIHPSFPLISIFFISLLPPLISFPWHLEDMVGGGKGGGGFHHFISPDEYISVGTSGESGGCDATQDIQTGRS